MPLHAALGLESTSLFAPGGRGELSGIASFEPCAERPEAGEAPV